NCGFGNADCARLSLDAIDWTTGIIDYPRPKTGIPPHCVLWPETVAAIREAIAHRPEPKQSELAKRVFITHSNGLHVVQEGHGLWRDGQRYFGLMEVRNGSNADDFGLVVGLRNSHDKSFPAALALGSRVFVCDNLAFSGEVKLSRKHTTYIWRDLP